MKRRSKKFVLGIISFCYVVLVVAYVLVILAASSWGSAWCDNCTPDQIAVMNRPRDDALREVLLYDALVFAAGAAAGMWWLRRPEKPN